MIEADKEKQDSVAFTSTWQDDLYENQRIHLRWSFIFNGALLLLLILLASILLILLPLKTTVPFVISHNKTTGEITQLGRLNPASYANDWTLTRHFLIRYISNRESFHPDNLERPYQITYALSDKTVAQAYEVTMDTRNPHSPFNRYSKTGYVTVNIHSVAALNDNTAEVRFEKVLHDRNSGQETKQPLIAIVKWRYDSMATTQAMLDRNPLGFHVTYYQPTYVNVN